MDRAYKWSPANVFPHCRTILAEYQKAGRSQFRSGPQKLTNFVEVSMSLFRRFRGFAPVCALFLLMAGPLFAQFTASIQGVVQDQSGAGVAKGSIQLVNVATGVTK